MGSSGVVRQSRRFGKPRSLLCLYGLGNGTPSSDAARYTSQRSASHGGTWSATPPSVTRETRPEEREGHYAHYLFRGRAKRLLGSIWVFLVRRNLGTSNRGDRC